MELCNWKSSIHRSAKEHLLQLAQRMRHSMIVKIRVEQEPEGINLFLVISRN